MNTITFIGSGISSSFTLYNFLKQLEEKNTSKKITINIIEKYSEFISGIPYGKRSGYSVLLITSLRDFLPSPELEQFISWINANKTELLNDFKNDGGQLSKEWLVKNHYEIENNEWEDLFIPRFFFGRYLEGLVNDKISKCEQKKLIKVERIIAEVIDIEKKGGGYEVFLNNDLSLYTDKAILAIGSLPIKYLWKSKTIIKDRELLLINNPYNPDLKTILKEIEQFIISRNHKETNVLIVGTNASGLELLYKLNDIKEVAKTINNFTFLSTKGLIPNATVDKERKEKFVPTHLNNLKIEDVLTAKKVADAAFKDLDYAEEIDLGAASTVEKISTAFGDLLQKLDRDELRIFACNYGNEIGRRQRCAGDHYLESIGKLINQGRFAHIAGRFDEVVKLPNDEYEIKYLETKSKTIKVIENPVHLVINCIGSMKYSNENSPQIIKNLVKKEYCIPNDSEIGFDVNDDFEASKNLYIIGPLLAGNVVDNKPIWHVEHCGRIMWLSKLLSRKIYESII